jgi:hypothetical protein
MSVPFLVPAASSSYSNGANDNFKGGGLAEPESGLTEARPSILFDNPSILLIKRKPCMSRFGRGIPMAPAILRHLQNLRTETDASAAKEAVA